MKSSLLKVVFGFAAMATGAEALACSCMGISNAQQTANNSQAIVARVTTKSLDQTTGEAQLTVQEVIKGDYKESSIEIQGGDGASCGSGIYEASEGEWVVIFFKSEYDGKLYTAGCADASLKVEDATGDVSVYLGGNQVELSEQEFSDFVNVKKIPTVTGITCSASVSRNLVNNYNKTVTNPIAEINFWENVSSTSADPFTLKYTKDFSAEGLSETYQLQASAYQSPEDLASVSYSANIREPFFGFTTNDSAEVNITEFVLPLSLDLTAYQALSGGSIDDKADQDPFNSFSASAYCDLNLGLPLVNYTKP